MPAQDRIKIYSHKNKGDKMKDLSYIRIFGILIIIVAMSINTISTIEGFLGLIIFSLCYTNDILWDIKKSIKNKKEQKNESK